MAETAAAGGGGATHGRHGSLSPRAGSIWQNQALSDDPGKVPIVAPVQASVAPQDARTTESGPDHSPVVNPSGPAAQVPDVGASAGTRHRAPPGRYARNPAISADPAADPDHRGRPVTARLVVVEGIDGRRVRIDLEPADLRPRRGGTAPGRLRHSRRQLHRRPPGTLQLLQRDARVVNDMLSAAGFTVDQGGLDFTCATPVAGTAAGNGSRARMAVPMPNSVLAPRRANQRDRTVAACWTCRFDMRAHSAPRRQ